MPNLVFSVSEITKLLGFAVRDMLADSGVVPTQFQTTRVVFAVLYSGVRVCALGAAQLNDDAVAFFAGHGIPHKIVYNLAHCTKIITIWQTIQKEGFPSSHTGYTEGADAFAYLMVAAKSLLNEMPFLYAGGLHATVVPNRRGMTLVGNIRTNYKNLVYTAIEVTRNKHARRSL